MIRVFFAFSRVFLYGNIRGIFGILVLIARFYKTHFKEEKTEMKQVLVIYKSSLIVLWIFWVSE